MVSTTPPTRDTKIHNQQQAEETYTLLVPSTGRRTAKLLWLGMASISDKQLPVVCHQNFLNFPLAGLIHILLVIGNNSLGDSLPDSVNLGCVTSSSHPHADVHIGKAVLPQKVYGFVGLLAQDLRFEQVDRAPIDLDEAAPLLAIGDSCGCLLLQKSRRTDGRKDA